MSGLVSPGEYVTFAPDFVGTHGLEFVRAWPGGATFCIRWAGNENTSSQ